jgi:hypothetical protein
MTTLAATLRTEVRRLAATEVNKVRSRLRRVQKQVRTLGLSARRQKLALSSLQRKVKGLRNRLAGRGPAGPPSAGPRVAPRTIRALRRRLKLTRVAFADLVGVSPGSIFGWEKGRSTPRGASRTRLVELAKSGPRLHRGRARRATATRRRRRPRV